MTPNIYFAYSISRDYDGLAALLLIDLPKKKKRCRACDACSVRKTRCDDSRPCSQCVNNGLECTELRRRKKSGPKRLRKKTIDSIHSLPKEPETAPHSALSPQTFTLPDQPDLDAVARHVAQLLPVVMAASSLFSASPFSSAISVVEAVSVPSAPSTLTDVPRLCRRLAALSYLLVMLTVAGLDYLDCLGDLGPLEDLGDLDTDSKTPPVLRTQLRDFVAGLYAECVRQHRFLPGAALSDSDYYLALLELHMYACSLVGRVPALEFVHLRAATTHWRLAHMEDPDSEAVRDLGLVLSVWERHASLFSPALAFYLDAGTSNHLFVPVVKMEPGHTLRSGLAMDMGRGDLSGASLSGNGLSATNLSGASLSGSTHTDSTISVGDSASPGLSASDIPTSYLSHLENVIYVYHDMLAAFDEVLMFPTVPAPYTWRYVSAPSGITRFPEVKGKVNACLNHEHSNSMVGAISRLLAFMLVLKAVQVCLKEMSRDDVAAELMELMVEVNAVLSPMNADLRVYVDVIGLVSQMLELLRAYLHVTAGEQLAPQVLDALLQLLSFVLFYTNHRFEYSDPILTEWFGRLVGPHSQYMETLE